MYLLYNSPQGERGPPGPIGFRGISGLPGFQGALGFYGTVGEPGAVGDIGDGGVKGKSGGNGKRGEDGPPGKPGGLVSIYRCLSVDYWTHLLVNNDCTIFVLLAFNPFIAIKAVFHCSRFSRAGGANMFQLLL